MVLNCSDRPKVRGPPRGFAFVGPTTMFALMEANGIVDTHLLGSHRRGTSGVWTPEGLPVE